MRVDFSFSFILDVAIDVASVPKISPAPRIEYFTLAERLLFSMSS